MHLLSAIFYAKKTNVYEERQQTATQGGFLMQKLLNLSKKGILKWQKKQHKMLRQK